MKLLIGSTRVAATFEIWSGSDELTRFHIRRLQDVCEQAQWNHELKLAVLRKGVANLVGRFVGAASHGIARRQYG